MKKCMIICYFFISFIFNARLLAGLTVTTEQLANYNPPAEKKIVVLIPSHNNAAWYAYNLSSVFGQKYQNFRVIYIDDASTDHTAQLVREYAQKNNHTNKITIIENKERRFKMENMYNAIHQHCLPEEIVFELDGDDWFINENVLNLVNKVYSYYNVWYTYGSLLRWDKARGFLDKNTNYCNEPFPYDVISKNKYREFGWRFKSPRTFYAWIFQKIKKEDLMDNGKFFDVLSDAAEMMPIFEMAGRRFRIIMSPIYVYNVTGNQHDFAHSKKKQLDALKIINSKPKYELLDSAPI